jgi:alpha-beta hydrolase superfamily lysophospholipase
VILVHMLTRTREDWHAVASRLSDAGFAALTFDLRGHGGSGGSPEDVAKMVLDLRAARAFLADRSDVQAGAIGVGGASVGASVAALMAADEPAVRSRVRVSPGLEYRGLRIETAMKKYGDRPALLLVGANDPYSHRSVKQLTTLGSGIRESRVLEASGHGTTLFTRAPDLVGTLVDWFQRTLL